MLVTRRRFLGIGLAAAAAWGGWRVVTLLRMPPPEPVLGGEPVGSLAPSTIAVLVAAAEAVAGYPIDPVHYETYYRWRAEHLRGYRALYERFAQEADRGAHRLGGRPFAAASSVVRREILAHGPRARAPKTAWDRLRVQLVDYDWPAFDRFVLGETIGLFARTDAWVALGYRGWPGMPRGLDRYRRFPG